MYFTDKESLDFTTNGKIDEELLRISTKYIADNPPNDFVFRIYDKSNFTYLKSGGYDLNFNEKFPNTPCGRWAYAYTKTVRSEDIDLNIVVSCYSPVEIYCNNELVFKPSLHQAVDVNVSAMVELKLHKGENNLLVKAFSTKSGFGCRIAPENDAWGWIQWLSPFDDFGGFAYSEPIGEDVIGTDIPVLSDENRNEFSFIWYPSVPETVTNCRFSKMFSREKKGILYGWSAIQVFNIRGEKVSFSIKAKDIARLWVGKNEITLEENSGEMRAEVALPYGKHEVLIAYDYKTSLDFEIRASTPFIKPYPVLGMKGSWLFTGPFADYQDMLENKLYKLFIDVDGKGCYWRADYNEGYVRPCLESAHFGKWTYPIGVALYGLISVAHSLKREDIEKYVKKHVNLCSKLYRYSIWDKETFGHPEINNEIVRLELLDDCGSFGSSMLEIFKGEEDEDIVFLADKIAKYIYEINPRREDGAQYRVREGHYVNNTLWADDLYMSIPFLCRYYKLSGDEKYIDMATEQFFLYKKYLFMSEYKIMSHVYDFKYNTYNAIPWGRGNGWVLFSLAELLKTVPNNYHSREKLIDFYRELSSGYLALQGKNGLWHQVLTEEDSYEETSCTSMFVYAFSCGVENGWFDEDDIQLYINAAQKGWKGITTRMTDQFGNVFGVCRGSGYTFLLDYYKNELNPILNDIHGIGIVLLAGVAFKSVTESIK